MNALHLSLLVLLLGGALIYALGYILANRPAPGEGAQEESPAPAPETLKRRRRRNAWTRALFVFWTVFIAAHRALSVWLILVADSGDLTARQGAGMTLVFVDPLGILLVLGGSAAFRNVFGVPLLPDRDLTALYIVGGSLLSAGAVYFLWRVSRHAFVRPAQAAPEPPRP